LALPRLCIVTNDRTEYVVSLSSEDPSRTGEALPFKKIPLAAGLPGTELRFHLERIPDGASLANYSLLYRDSSKREHRRQGSDTLPEKQN
jgi:hypothetical protein